MPSFRLTQRPIIPLFFLLLINSVCGIPTPSQTPHSNEITLALTTRGDDPSLASLSSPDWTYADNIWPTSLQNINVPTAKVGAHTLAASTENVDFVPGTPDAPTPEQQPGKLQKGENGCPTMFPMAVCDPGEGVTGITKAALPGFVNLDKCRQSMLSRLPPPLFISFLLNKKKARQGEKRI